MVREPRHDDPAFESGGIPVPIVDLMLKVNSLEKDVDHCVTKAGLAKAQTRTLIWLGGFIGIAAVAMTAIARIWPVHPTMP